jgi:hypothetical protein
MRLTLVALDIISSAIKKASNTSASIDNKLKFSIEKALFGQQIVISTELVIA